MASTTTSPPNAPQAERVLFGLGRKTRFRIYRWMAFVAVLGFVIWAWSYLQPARWETHTDQVAFSQVARDVELGHVIWEPAEPAAEGFTPKDAVGQPSVSADGTRMVYSNGKGGGNADLFTRRWDGVTWGKAQAVHALNSAFHETAPAMSPDGRYLYFATDRPGGRGGDDIWVAKWDGHGFAWPLPLTGRVNTPFTETDPAPSPDNGRLYFASDRPYMSEKQAIKAAELGGQPLADVAGLEGDYNLYVADTAGDMPVDLIVERQLSMLYSLREGALADIEVMQKLGGSRETEKAIDRGLAYLAETQEEDGRWDIRKSGGAGGHDVGATAFALLAYYGRGERHDRECKYQDTVKRGLVWLLSQQDGASGDLRGARPQHNAMYDHGIASLALIEAYGVTKDTALRPRAIAAVEFMTESQHAGGGWRYRPGERGDLSVTGWYIMALASAEMSGIPVPEKTVAGARKFLEYVSGGEHGGSYGYTDPPGRRGSRRHGMDAAGFFCSLLTGASPNGAQAWEASRILRQNGLRHNDLYYIYYGTIAAYQYQGKLWDDWRKQMQRGFLKSQGRDGSWRASGGHGSAMGRAISTALTILCLEAHYRYTPLYGLGYQPPEEPVANTIGQADLPPTPLFRHAKYIEEFNSPGDDTAPVLTDHGDFLYFASAREGGLGGSDIYRARISGELPGAVENLGEKINTTHDESDPAIRMAGFHLLFNSDRESPTGALYSAKSRRLVRQQSMFQLPGFGWMLANLPWILLFLAGAGGCCFLTKRALAQTRGAA